MFANIIQSWTLIPMSSCAAVMYLVYQHNGIVVRASTLQSVDLGFISQVESYQKNKLAILLVVSLGKALNGMPVSLCDGAKQSTHRGGSSPTKDLQTEGAC